VTKLGARRTDDGRWHHALDRDALRAGNDRDRRVLGLDTVPVTHLRWMDGAVTFDEALDTMVEMREEGRIARIGLSNVSAAQLDAALRRTEIVTVSNHFGPTEAADAPTLDRCTAEGIAYLPFFPLAGGRAGQDAGLAAVAAKHGATPAQVSIAWLLRRSPVMLPIPGTGRVAHLEENVAAADLVLDDEDLARI
jgi:aryl-alcohol dehydrogenase-like predicted oxidoreductase